MINTDILSYLRFSIFRDAFKLIFLLTRIAFYLFLSSTFEFINHFSAKIPDTFLII